MRNPAICQIYFIVVIQGKQKLNKNNDNYCNWSTWIENTIIGKWKDSNFNNFLSKCQSLQDVLKLMKHSFVASSASSDFFSWCWIATIK